MNKKAYITPAFEEVEIKINQALLTASSGEGSSVTPPEEPGGNEPRW